MPSLKSGYSLADFLLRLERSPVTHMSPLYHENRQLFLHRPDVFDKIVLSLSWEKGLALLDTAYYTQKIEVSTYRALLARMLLHNKHVDQQQQRQLSTFNATRTNGLSHGGDNINELEDNVIRQRAGYVDWRAAMKVYKEALTAHGNAVPSRLGVSTLRLLTPHGQSAAALQVLRIAETNEKLTKPMLIDAAACCARGREWQEALRLLDCLHREDPQLLADAIQSLRPVGMDALSGVALPDSERSTVFGEDGLACPPSVPLFPGNSAIPAPPTDAQKHILRSLNAVVAAVPWQVALTNELCFSYLTHLTASTTLSAEKKAAALGSAISQLPWTETVLLLGAYAEPNLVTDGEWKAVLSELPHPKCVLLAGSSVGKQNESIKEAATVAIRKRKKHKAGSTKKKMAAEQPAPEIILVLEVDEVEKIDGKEEHGEAVEAENAKDIATAGVMAVVPSLASSAALAASQLQQRLRLADCSPATAAAFVAVLASKMPTVLEAWDVAVRGTQGMANTSDAPEVNVPLLAPLKSGDPDDATAAVEGPRSFGVVNADSLSQAVAAARQLHPAVRRAMLRRCATAGATTNVHTTKSSGGRGQQEADVSWPVAAALLLSQGSAHGRTPAGVLSPLLLELRAAKQVPLVVRLLLEHVVPTGSTVSEVALEAIFECILAHNRAAHQLSLEATRHAQSSSSRESAGQAHSESAHQEAAALTTSYAAAAARTVVHWQSALSWATDLQARRREPRITQTGTGPSSGGVQRRTAATVAPETPLSPRLLSLLVHICVDAGAPQAALEAIGRARRADKTELDCSAEISALLHCVLYDRPCEAEAIVRQAAEKKGTVRAAPLRQLLALAQSAKMREETEAALRQVRGEE